MARERETSTRSRNRDDDEPATRTRSRSNDRSAKKGGSTTGKKIAINLDPKSYEQYGLWGDGEDVLVQDLWAAPFNYGGKMRDDGKPQTTLAIFAEYLDEATGDVHVEPVSYGDLRHYAPGNSPNEFDFAGGDETTWAKIANGEKSITEEMRGAYILPVPQSFDDNGDPVYRRLTGTRGSNGDFYIQQAIECGKSAGIKIAFDPDDPNLRNLLRGVRGRVAKLGNTLRKGGGGSDFGGEKSKPLVFEEIYERVDLDKSDKAGSGSRKRADITADDDDADEKPVTRRRGAAAPEPEEAEEPTPASRRGRKKAASDGPSADFLADFETKVEAALSELPKKSSKRTRLTHLMDEYEDRDEAKWALDILTEDEYIDSFWAASELWDYDDKTDTASL